MMLDEVMECDIGSVVAPAGCGKTQLIIDILSIKQSKPYLVLTHTTAGVSALKRRLRNLKVPAENYVVTTIDGWSLRIANSFPRSCPIQYSMDNERLFYPELRQVVLHFLNTGALNQIIKASYSKLFVDEYQDCNSEQHAMVVSLSSIVPTVVFGDPMQCIFDFRNAVMPNWELDVQRIFPLIGTLNTPWRWNNAKAPQLGLWILEARELLKQNRSIDLLTCPNHIFWHALTGNTQTDLTNQRHEQHSILNRFPTDSLLVIGSSVNELSRHKYAQSSSRIEVVEKVSLETVIAAARQFDLLHGKGLVDKILQVASTMLTNIEIPQTTRRIETILNGRSRSPVTPSEQALCNIVANSSRHNILAALQQLELKQGTRLYRRAAYTALKDTISLSISVPEKTISEAASIVRERVRQEGDRRIPNRAIGSTLLLKGLEADHCLILDAQGQGMNARHLYVALSRGAKTVTIFSKYQHIG
ncbi:TPA: UvrD-helicase domain-containing protein [Yersinia enterocolitica]|uniref:UvrD-helicase domain-containing protein n=1 Tax=Yersinia enterocolitica TaxID=630 RepID=UPI0021E8135A|nr:UvrD-helicase domain-containing protein [Yersinia enterocolitica]UYJ99426.1 UvrD-helicase domain-containing protein [Yersinia enterocolitica]